MRGWYRGGCRIGGLLRMRKRNCCGCSRGRPVKDVAPLFVGTLVLGGRRQVFVDLAFVS